MPIIDVAVVYDDGRKEVVRTGRPADLIAFADNFEKLAPSEPYAIRELAWLVHRALKLNEPLDEWVATLEDLTADADDVAALRKELAQANPPQPSPKHEPTHDDGQSLASDSPHDSKPSETEAEQDDAPTQLRVQRTSSGTG